MQLVYSLRKGTKREISAVHDYFVLSAAATAEESERQREVLTSRALDQLGPEIEIGSVDQSAEFPE